MQRALYQARAVIGEHPNHPMADEQHGLSTEGAAGRGKRADKVAGDKAATGRAAEQAGMEALVKAGPEDAVDTLANWEEVEAAFRPFPCVHSMLSARGPVVFALDACSHELDELPTETTDAIEAQKLLRHPHLVLNESECHG